MSKRGKPVTAATSLTLGAAAMAAMVLLPAAGSSASDIFWNVASGGYGTPANWNTGTVPTSADTAYVTNGGEADIADAAAYSLANLNLNAVTAPFASGSALSITSGSLGVSSTIRTGSDSILTVDGGGLSASNLYVASQVTLSAGTISVSSNYALARGGSGRMDITDGTLNGGNFYVGSNSGSVGTVNQSGGTVNMRVRIGENYVSGYGEGVYNLSGTGVLTSTTRLSVGMDAPGTFNMTGGTVHAPTNATIIGNTAAASGSAMNISGGTADFSGGIQVGTGTLRITGNGASVSASGTIRGGTDSTLDFQIGSSGVSTISMHVANTFSSGQNTKLAGILDIDLLGGFAPATGQTFDLISTNSTYTGTASGTGNYTNGFDVTALTLAPADQPYWSFAVVHDSVNNLNILRLTNTAPVPEPASVALLVLAAPAMLRRRRV